MIQSSGMTHIFTRAHYLIHFMTLFIAMPTTGLDGALTFVSAGGSVLDGTVGDTDRHTTIEVLTMATVMDIMTLGDIIAGAGEIDGGVIMHFGVHHLTTETIML